MHASALDIVVRSQPLVSVLVPIFNGQRYLRQALESLQNQTYGNLEIILVNDGSTDGSAAIIDSFVENEKRAIAVHKKNTGLTDTLNYGLSLANGVWLSRSDHDDVAFPTKLERQMETVLGNPSLVLVGCDFCTLTEESGQMRRYHLPTGHNQLVRRLQRVQSFFPHSSALFRLDVARQVGGYDIDALYNEDWDLWLRLSELGEVSSVAESLVTIRKHQTQMTKNSGDVIPQGEAFVSSVLHFLRTDPSLQLDSQDFRELEVRRQVRETESYQNFCRVIQSQEQFQRRITGKRTLVTKAVQVLLSLILLNKTILLFKYVVAGTNQPRTVSLTMREKLLSAHQRCRREGNA